MGLLDVFLNGTGNAEQDAAINRGLLAAGLQLMQSRGRLFPAIGQAGMAGLGASDAYRQQTEAQKRAQLQDQLLKGQLTQQQQQQEQQQRMQQWLQGLQSPQMQASQAALAGGGGPTVENAAKMQPVDPQQQLMFDAVRNGALPLPAYLAAQQKDTSPLAVPEGTTLIDRKTGRPMFTNPKTQESPAALKEYQFAVSQGYKGTFDQWDLARKRATASNVSVNTGQKGYENESKLRNDFKTEPIYKDFQDMQSAYKQIKAGIAQGTPIGDLATATKIMKLLDPGSVVRESELGMAMAATGRMDRLKNYVQMQISGAKLTDTQRKEFGALADELYASAAQIYNAKRSEYEKMGSRYQLDTTVLGSPAEFTVKRFNPATGKIE